MKTDAQEEREIKCYKYPISKLNFWPLYSIHFYSSYLPHTVPMKCTRYIKMQWIIHQNSIQTSSLTFTLGMGKGGVMLQDDMTHCKNSFFQTHLVRRNSDVMETYSCIPTLKMHKHHSHITIHIIIFPSW